jgi:hypothetical protein
MYANQKNLIQDVKREILAELKQGNETNISWPAGTSSGPNYRLQGDGAANNPYATSQTYQTVKDSVKNEILAEIQMQQADQIAEMYGLGRSLSDQKIQQMVDSRYRTIDNMKADIKRELLAHQKMETQRSKDPHLSQIAGILAGEAQRQGIPLERVIQGLGQKGSAGNGTLSRILELLNTGQRKGFLCGIGTSVLFSLLWPLARGNMRPVAARSIEEGISMVGRAKNFICGNYQQKPPSDLASFDPGPPPDPNQPPQSPQPPQPPQPPMT